jgi:hypothetical protein
MEDDELNLGGLRDYACTAMEQVGLSMEPLEQPCRGRRSSSPAMAAVVWVEVGRLQNPDRAEWLLSQRHRMREGAIAMLPEGRVVIRGWRLGELESFTQLARLLSTLLTTAQA